MAMPNLEDPQDEWEVEEVLNHWTIKNTVHYLVKWASWPFKYNSYELVAHLAKAPEAIVAFERKLKHKRKKSKGAAPGKRARRIGWIILYLGLNFDFWI